MAFGWLKVFDSIWALGFIVALWVVFKDNWLVLLVSFLWAELYLCSIWLIRCSFLTDMERRLGRVWLWSVESLCEKCVLRHHSLARWLAFEEVAELLEHLIEQSPLLFFIVRYSLVFLKIWHFNRVSEGSDSRWILFVLGRQLRSWLTHFVCTGLRTLFQNLKIHMLLNFFY